MASDLLLGWIIGLITVVFPQMALKILSLKRQLRFLANPQTEQPHRRKFWLFGKRK